jgi:hypothetical protein
MVKIKLYREERKSSKKKGYSCCSSCCQSSWFHMAGLKEAGGNEEISIIADGGSGGVIWFNMAGFGDVDRWLLLSVV